jgi:hypothetical protein
LNSIDLADTVGQKRNSYLLLRVKEMDIKKNKRMCGNCKDWQGPREKDENGCTKVRPSARGKCEQLNMAKPPHGGCAQWQYCWEKQED